MMKLKEIRKQKKLTQEKLSELSGIDQTTISNIEVGRVKSPEWYTVYHISRALGERPEKVFPVRPAA